MTIPKTNTRLLACKILLDVLKQGLSLKQTLQQKTADLPDLSSQAKAQTQALCYGVLREYDTLQLQLSVLLQKSLRNKDQDIELLILLGLYELSFTQAAQHAVVSEIVNAVKKRKKLWATKLVNGVLRNAIRTQESDNPYREEPLPPPSTVKYHWLLEKLQQHYPDQWQDIWHNSNQAPPMHIRVNQQKISRNNYLESLNTAKIGYLEIGTSRSGTEIHSDIEPCHNNCITLAKPTPVSQLPHFFDGYCSVQDLAAQQAAELLHPKAGEKILDACAAPGGKTAHLLEHCPDINLLALELDPIRAKKIHENLNRLALQATIKTGDGIKEDWFDGELFDKILLDAPCSGTGVIRRNPDIKFLRKATDIDQLVKTQQQLLHNLWKKLKPGGQLLYATCSILPEENTQQIQDFLKSNTNAKLMLEQQLLPKPMGYDGFYYALLAKNKTL